MCCKALAECPVLVFPDDVEPNSLAAIPGMGIPEQLKSAMEQEQTSADQTDTEH